MKNWKFDKEHSQLLFEARHLMITNVIGQFEDFEVKAQIQGEDFEKAQFEMMVQAGSLTTWNRIRDNHLKASDFLDVKKYPTLKFRSTSLKRLPDGNYELKGILTIRDTAKEVSLLTQIGGRVKDSYSGEIKTGYSISGKIDRRDWGVDFSLPLENGGLAVGHHLKIRAELEFVHRG